MSDPKITIIGAGISGLAAANRLITSGFTDVLILEAKDRVGGRILTQTYDNSFLEFGAQWIHGEGQNPLFLMAEEHNYVWHGSSDESDDDDDDDGFRFYRQDGTKIRQKKASRISRVFEAIGADADKFARQNVPLPVDVGDSVGRFLSAEFDKHLQSHPPDDPSEHMGMLEWQKCFQKSDNACTDLDEVSLRAWGQYLEFAGNQDVVLAEGYQPLLDLLLKDIPEASIRLNSEVTRINWNQLERPKPIGITLSDGETLDSDYVIFTGSLGVLKERAASLFVPSIGTDKTEVISSMGFGVVNKIFLEFSEPFWSDDCYGFHLVYLPDSGSFRLDCLDQEHIDKYGEWYRAIHTFEVLDIQPNCLLGWISGTEAAVMEQIDEDTVRNVCIELLTRFTGKSVPNPRRMIRTRWHSEEHILGSYTYVKSNHTAENCDVLMEPLPSEQTPRLLFAGEATYRSRYSTADGALSSGYREADRIVRAQETSTTHL